MIYVGTSGFCESMKKYFQDYKTVEIQQTFYRILEVKILEKWKKIAPKDFIFNFKAFQGITHTERSSTWKRSNLDINKLKGKVGFLKPTKEVLEFWKKMVEYAKILESRVVLIQLPESFSDTPENWENAEKFFRNIERENFEIGVELRGWKEERIKKFCKRFEVIDVCDINLRFPVCQTKIYYFRLHGSYKNGKINYYHNYSLQELQKIKEKIEKIKSEEIFVYFNNIFMKDNSRQFLHLYLQNFR